MICSLWLHLIKSWTSCSFVSSIAPCSIFRTSFCNFTKWHTFISVFRIRKGASICNFWHQSINLWNFQSLAAYESRKCAKVFMIWWIFIGSVTKMKFIHAKILMIGSTLLYRTVTPQVLLCRSMAEPTPLNNSSLKYT